MFNGSNLHEHHAVANLAQACLFRREQVAVEKRLIEQGVIQRQRHNVRVKEKKTDLFEKGIAETVDKSSICVLLSSSTTFKFLLGLL